jgi:glycosyltransferase involved in cell wall biosynthesis
MRVLSIAFALATVGDGAVGGAEQILAHIDRALVAAGHDSVVVASSNSQVHGRLFGTAAAPEFITRDYYSFRYTEHSRKIQEALKSEPVDLIHMHGFDFYEFLPTSEIPVLDTLHLPPEWYPEWIFYMQRPNLHLNCVSESQRRGTPHGRLIAQTIQNGVQIPELEPLRLSERKSAVILGRICREKGTHIGIEAARKAGVPLKIAGRAFGYPEHLHYFEHYIQPALNDRVEYLGPVGVRRKIELLDSAKCVLVPSLAPETSSLCAMEALACGTPVIAMRTGALPEIVEHGKTGFLVDSADAMADAISRVDEIDPMTCRQTAVVRFSADRMAREYMSLYERLIDSKKHILIPREGSLVVSDQRTS